MKQSNKLIILFRDRGFLKTLGPWVLCFYLLVSMMFCGIYYQTTYSWSAENFLGYADSHHEPPFGSAIFKYRVLMPLLGRGLASVTGADLRLVYCGLAFLSVFCLLIAYRGYLSNFLRPEFATVMSVGIVYPMLWNFCLLNNIYLPFDLPAVLFFILGCHYIYQRKWHIYYPVFVLAVLNRDTSGFLVFVLLFCLFREMKSGRLLRHLIAHVFIYVGLKYLLYSVLGPDPRVFSTCRLTSNVKVVSDILAFSGNGPKDLAKLVLVFGGTWLAIPWLYRTQPRFLKRCILTMIPFLVVISFMGVIDESRCYAEMIPVILTPVIYAVAHELGGTINPRGPQPRGHLSNREVNNPEFNTPGSGTDS